MALHGYIVGEVALDCAEGVLTRREALRRLGLLGLSSAAAGAVLAACGGDDDDGVAGATTTGSTTPVVAPSSSAAAGSTVGPPASVTTAGGAATAPSPVGEDIRFPGPGGELIGVLSSADEPAGAVLVIHENRGLTEHHRSLPQRLSAEGYTALAIDLLSRQGGTASLPTEGDAQAALGNAPAEQLIEDLRAGLDELSRRAPGSSLAVIGFCFGGGMTWNLLGAGEPRLAAAVPFYGPYSEGTTFDGSPNAAVLGIYAGLDSRVNASREAAGAALEAAGLTYELRTFDGVDHAFFNDTGPRYDEAAATEAFDAMIAWFGQHLT